MTIHTNNKCREQLVQNANASSGHSLFREIANKGYDDDFVPMPLKSEPTEFPPGSPERIAAYAARLMRGEDLWCDEDGRFGDDDERD